MRTQNQDYERRIAELEALLQDEWAHDGMGVYEDVLASADVIQPSATAQPMLLRQTRQKKSRNDDPRKNLYFGNLSLGEVIQEVSSSSRTTRTNYSGT